MAVDAVVVDDVVVVVVEDVVPLHPGHEPLVVVNVPGTFNVCPIER